MIPFPIDYRFFSHSHVLRGNAYGAETVVWVSMQGMGGRESRTHPLSLLPSCDNSSKMAVYFVVLM